MSSSLPLTPDQNCCLESCDDAPVAQLPGPAGASAYAVAVQQGFVGTEAQWLASLIGEDGLNAFTTTTAQFVVPAELATVIINVVDSSWAALSQVIYIQNAGWYRVTAKPSTTQLTVRNLEDSATGGYTENSAPTTVVASGSKVCPGGLQGPSGGTPAGTAFAIANNLSEGTAATMRSNLGLGTMATQAASAVAITGGTIAGITDLAVADGGTGASAAAGARTNLGLVIGTDVQAFDATLASIATLGTVADRIAYTTALDTWAETPLTAAGRAIIDDADATAQRTTIGLNRAPQDLLVYEHQALTTVNGGDFTSGAWRTVPLSTEVADTGGQGSIAASIITLAAGTYRFRGRVCGYQVGNFQCRLFNVDAASVIQYGSNTTSAAADGCQEYSLIEGRFTLAIATQIRLEAQCQTTNTGDGFGLANSFGGTEIYSALVLEREAG